MAVSLLGKVLATGEKAVIGGTIGSALAPALRPVTYLANSLLPNNLPGVGEFLSLYHSGNILRGTLNWGLNQHGISTNDNNLFASFPAGWERLIRLARSKPADGTVLDLYLRDKIGVNEALARLKELGYSMQSERELLLGLESQFGVGDVLNIYHRDRIDKDQAERWLRRLGYITDPGINHILSAENPLNLGDVLRLYLRGLLSDSEVNEHMKRMGIRLPLDRRLLTSLSDMIPPITDLVRFVKRDTFDEELVNQFGLDDEYDLQRERYEFWAGTQGLGEMTLPGSPNGESINWPKMYYRADWQYISPTQGYEALHRFRPSRIHLYRSVAPGIRPFDIGDMYSVLKASDYPKSMRDWLVGSSYNLLTLTDIKSFYTTGALGSIIPDADCNTGDSVADAQCSPARREMYELYQDRGYKPADAARLANNTAAAHTAKTRRLVFGQARAVIADAYRTGVLGREDAAVRLYRLRFETTRQRADFDALDFVVRAGLALADPETAQAIAHIDFHGDLQLVKQTVGYIRSGYFTGRWDRNETIRQLERLGIRPEKVDKYLRSWDAKRDGSRKMLSVAQLMKYARYGILTVREVRRRLGNFGYTDQDSDAIIGNIGRDVSLDTNRQLEKAARTEQQRQRALQQQIRQLEKERRDAEKRLSRLGTAAQLSAWVERGLMSPERMLRRLLATGVSQEDAESKVAEAVAKRDERIARLQRS